MSVADHIDTLKLVRGAGRDVQDMITLIHVNILNGHFRRAAISVVTCLSVHSTYMSVACQAIQHRVLIQRLLELDVYVHIL